MELILIFGIATFGLVCAFLLSSFVMKQDCGTAEMQKISNAIKEGAEAFLRRMNKTIALLSIVFAACLFAFYFYEKGMEMAWKMTLGFLLGALSSALSGFVGMYVSIRTNIRTAAAARTSLPMALKVSLRGGAVSGLAVVAFSLLGVTGLFLAFGGGVDLAPSALKTIALQVVGYGFGASFVALFAQLGGGIYTKAADVGADLVGKVEAGIPEDDPRNPAVIADLVGDNVGDCAGRGADLFESTAAENVGAMVLGAFLAEKNPAIGVGVVFFPLVARAFGIIASVVGLFAANMKSEDEDPMSALNRGYNITSLLAFGFFFVAVKWLLGNIPGHMWFFWAGAVGVLTSYIFVLITQYYTEYKYRPVRSIAESCVTGPATNIITGIAVGLECTAAPVVVISIAIYSAYWMGEQALAGGGLYGTAVATMGMLSTAAYILAMDTFGPITDNAGGIVEMSHQPEDIRKRTDRLDSVGNTTKALTKGYAIGSAALAAFLLFSAYLDEVSDLTGAPFRSVDLAKLPVFIGALVGAGLVFLFSAFAIKAVGNVAQYVIQEVRRQFKENPGIMTGTSQPNYASCVDIVTLGSLKAMVLPGLLAVLVPVAIGIIFKHLGAPGEGAEAVAGLLMVGTIAGILMATFMNNGGGAWDNAKKYIETGAYGGKRSDAHKAAVVGDTVGDPFKDTAGPSLHVLIKLLSTITLLLAPLFI